MQVLQQIVDGCGEAFGPYVTPELLEVLFRALLHQNRFVRETCYHILAALCALCSHEQLLSFSDRVAERLQDGLNENWSQVHTCETLEMLVCLSVDADMLTAEQLTCACYLLVTTARTMHGKGDEGACAQIQDIVRALLSELG